ncbi:MAG: hypothetical protein H7A52_11785 [Akkermansiaceae bacterium]|nr:hypothetical protein [Akkermansiaceae bacterium]
MQLFELFSVLFGETSGVRVAPGLFWILAWGFLVAAIIWLLIWLLLRAECPEGAAASASEAGEDTEITASETKTDAAIETAATGAVAATVDPNADDLTRLGISPELAAALNAKGITRFEQVADWSPEEIASLSADHPGLNADDLPWRARALADGLDPDALGGEDADPAYGPPHAAPAEVDHGAVIASEFSGQDVRADQDLGVVYNSGATPAHTDDLKEIKGVGPKLEEELHRYGVFCFKQIANWSDHNVAEFAQRLNCFKNRIERDRWLPQAAAKDCAGADDAPPRIQTATAEEAAAQFSAELTSGDARQDATYGIVFTSAPETPDDLKKIKGVAKVLEGKLNEIGVYKYRQIAFWTEPAVKEFSKLLTSFKDRIYRDNWIAQAKSLHEEKYGEKL